VQVFVLHGHILAGFLSMSGAGDNASSA